MQKHNQEKRKKKRKFSNHHALKDSSPFKVWELADVQFSKAFSINDSTK